MNLEEKLTEMRKEQQIPSEVEIEIRQGTLSLKNFLVYKLYIYNENGINFADYLDSKDREIYDMYGIEKLKKIDVELFNYEDDEFSIVNLLKKYYETYLEDINWLNRDLYDEIISEFPPSEYPQKLKERYPNRLFDLNQATDMKKLLKIEGLSETDIKELLETKGLNETDIKNLMEKFNNCELTIEEIFQYYDLFKTKDLGAILAVNLEYNNVNQDLQDLFKKMMKNDKYRSIWYVMSNIKAIRSHSIANFCNFLINDKDDINCNKMFNEILDIFGLESNGDFLSWEDSLMAGLNVTSVHDYPPDTSRLTNSPNEVIREFLTQTKYNTDDMSELLDSSISVAKILINKKLCEAVKNFGAQNFLDYDEAHGNIFSMNNSHNLLITGIEELLYPETVESEAYAERLERWILNHDMIYTEKMFTQEFIDSHPQFFVREDVPEDIALKFYKKELTNDDFKENAEYFRNTFMYLGFTNDIYDEFSQIIDLYIDNDDDYAKMNEKLNKIILLFSKINDFNIKDGLKNMIIGNHDIDIDLLSENIEQFVYIYNLLKYSNSSEISSCCNEIFNNFLETYSKGKNTQGYIDSIENIFLDRNKPYYIKVYEVFSLLHPHIEDLIQSNSSPTLQNIDDNMRKAIIQNDLKNIMERSNNRTVRYSLEDTTIMDALISETNDRNKRFAYEHSLIRLKPGDIIKGFEEDYVGDLLQNGFRAKEFLGTNIPSDATPLDTDVSIIEQSLNLDRNNFEIISETTTGLGRYGDIYAIMKQDDRFQANSIESANSASENEYRMELFPIYKVGDHYGIRTGFPSSAVNYFIVDTERLRNIEKIELEIAINGFYIPIYDLDGHLLFTPEQYDELREKMSGLSYYGGGDYQLSKNLNIDSVDIAGIIAGAKGRENEASQKRNEILKLINEVMGKNGIKIKTELDGDLSRNFAEFIDTGSTGRKTNIPGDGDFDFIMRLDGKYFMDNMELEEIQKQLLQVFGKEKHSSDEVIGKDFRLKQVEIANIEKPVDIDISFIHRTDRVIYSTDMCVKERLETIKKQCSREEYEQVIANIVLAKMVLKGAGVYKPARSTKTDFGGLGGIGIENWILQNGGSFYDAMSGFIENSRNANGERISFEEFKKKYPIWDFGENHKETRNLHDNFICNMNSQRIYTNV